MLAPEIQLLYKGTRLRPKDQADFALGAPALDQQQRDWLRYAFAAVVVSARSADGPVHGVLVILAPALLGVFGVMAVRDRNGISAATYLCQWPADGRFSA